MASKHPIRQAATTFTAAALAMTTLGAATMPAYAEDPTPTPTPTDTASTPAQDSMSASVHGKTIPLTLNGDTWTGEASVNGAAIVAAINATGTQAGEARNVQLNGSTPKLTSVSKGTPGNANTTYQVEYTGSDSAGRHYDITVDYTYTMATPVTVNGGGAFSLDNGKYVASATTDMTGITPSVNDITLSNGQKLPIDWGAYHFTVKDGKLTGVREGVAAGTIRMAFENAPDGSEQSWPVQVSVTAETHREWTVDINGTPTPFTTEADGTQTLTLGTQTVKPSDLTVTAKDGETFTMAPKLENVKTEPSGTLGVITVSGTATYHADKLADGTRPAFNITMPFTYTVGTPVTLNPDIPFTLEDGTYKATTSAFTLDTRNKPDGDSVELSDGHKATVTWAAKPTVVEKQTADGGVVKYVRLTGTASGTVSVTDPLTGKTVDMPFTVDTTADRAQDTSFTSLSVSVTDENGQTGTIPVPGFNPDTHEYTLPAQPHADMKNQYDLTPSVGVDATVTDPTYGLDGTTRVLRLTVNGTVYTVNVPFQPADIVADSPAKLEGIYVDYSGQDMQGQLIDGWNPNRLDYTIALKDANQSPYILPVAPQGVTVKAGKVTQSAQSTRQEWVVTDTASGASRTYSVTVLRPVTTAVTTFKAADPVLQTPTKPAVSPSDTALQSVGYVTKDGTYTPVNEPSFTIPEGATFSYEPKIGQTATVSYTRNGMAYDYTVNVLAPDGRAFAQHKYSVTYLTAATHMAQLNGIIVNGQKVPGFKPDKTDYTVYVDNTEVWTVVADYDKESGMSVSVDKHGAQAVLTVTSGDNIVQRSYTVTVKQALFKGNGQVGVGGQRTLADTGANIGGVGLLALMAAAGAGLLSMVSARRKNGRHTA